MGTLRRIGGAWSGYDVPGLVALLSQEDANAISQQLGGWWRAETALIEYRRRLEACRDALAQKWPPERSEAAAAFVQQVNATIEELRAAVSAIGRNAGALAQTDNILSLAKHELGSINREWLGYATREKDAEIEAQTLTLGEVKPTGLDPEWRERLNQRARKLMSSVERDIAASAQGMVSMPGPSGRENAAFWDPGTSAPTNGMAVVTGGLSGATGVGRSEIRPPQVPPPRVPAPGVSGRAPDGLELSGMSPSAPPPVGVGTAMPLDPSGRGGSSSPLPPPVPVSPTGPGRGPGKPRLGGPRTVSEQRQIDGMRVNPVGGVISGDRTIAARANGGSGTAAERGMLSGGFGVPGRGASRGSSSEYAGRREQEWHVAEGGPAVLQPAEEACHDPGPGVIGLDR